MPELPEVEVTKRGVEPLFMSGPVQQVWVHEPRLRWPVPSHLAQTLHGQRAQKVWRRGKYLLIDFLAGTMIIHLGMTGSLVRASVHVPRGKHDHVEWGFEGVRLRLRDPRRFGAVLWHPAEQGSVLAHPSIAKLGVEPFDPQFDGAWLYQHTLGRSAAIKQVLLSGDVVVGVGNIYCSEALFRAGIRPTRAANRVSRERYEALALHIRDTLSQAIELGGSTLRDFRGTDGEIGQFQLDYFAYEREGQNCKRCDGTIKRIVQGQRSTFFCPSCQK